MGLFSTPILGLDIGASSIKLVEGQMLKSGKFQLSNFLAFDLPSGVVSEIGVEDPNSVSDQLKNALIQLKKKKPLLSSGIKGPGVLTKRVSMPKVPVREIPQQVKWEAEQVFPADINSIFVTHILLGEIEQLPMAPPGTKGWDILLVGVRRDVAQAIYQIAEFSDSKLKILDLEAFALMDFLGKALNISPEETVAFVDVGASATRVFVWNNAKTVFLREFSIGGNAFSDAISSTLGLSFEDAEALKIQDSSAIPEEAVSALQGQMGNWKNELQQCEDIYVTQSNNELIEKWCFFGGGFLTPGLKESLEDERFAGKVLVVGPGDIFQLKNNKINPEFFDYWGPRLLTGAALAARRK